MHEPQRRYSDGSPDSSSDTDSSSDEMQVVLFEGRCKMEPSKWCKCGKCVTQKTDPECYCCMEHELLLDRLTDRELQCFTDMAKVRDYVAHKPSLETAYIQGMMRGSLRGPAPAEGEFTNK